METASIPSNILQNTADIISSFCSLKIDGVALREALEQYEFNASSKDSSTPVCMISVAEAAKLLGVSNDTVRRMYRDGVIRVIRVRRQVRIPMSEIVNLKFEDFSKEQEARSNGR